MRYSAISRILARLTAALALAAAAAPAALAQAGGAGPAAVRSPHATRPTQLATSRPEDVRIRLGPRRVASDTLGRDNPTAQEIQWHIKWFEGLVKEPLVRREPLKTRGAANRRHPSPRHPKSELCRMCPALVTKLR